MKHCGNGNNGIQNYRDLIAWRKARQLVSYIYKITKLFPRDEIYGLTQQLRRAAVSVPSNIAEGYGRGSLKDYLRFLQIARGSLYEVETQLLLAEDLEYLNGADIKSTMEHTNECIRVLQGLIKSLSQNKGINP